MSNDQYPKGRSTAIEAFMQLVIHEIRVDAYRVKKDNHVYHVDPGIMDIMYISKIAAHA